MQSADRYYSSGPGTATAFLALTMIVGFGFPLMVKSEAGGLISMILLLALVFFAGWWDGTGLRGIGLNRPLSWRRTVLLGLLYAGIFFVVFRIGLEPLLETLTGSERDLSRFDYLRGNTGALANTLIVLWLTAAFFEEVMFRGFLITNIEKILGNRKGSWIAGLLISSALFALAHGYQGLSGVLLTGLAAIFLGLIFLYHGRNLWITIFAHGFTDTSGALMVYLDVYDQVTSVLIPGQ